MKTTRIFRFASFLLALIVILCACGNMASMNNFYGGELLDDEKMSEIRSAIFPAETDEKNDNSTEANSTSEKTKPVETEKATDEYTAITDKETVGETEDITECVSDEETHNSEGVEEMTEAVNEEKTTEVMSDGEKTEAVSDATEEKTDPDVVYWTENGKVWHVKRDCGHIKKSKVIISGSVEDAIAAEKERACSTCGK